MKNRRRTTPRAEGSFQAGRAGGAAEFSFLCVAAAGASRRREGVDVSEARRAGARCATDSAGVDDRAGCAGDGRGCIGSVSSPPRTPPAAARALTSAKRG